MWWKLASDRMCCSHWHKPPEAQSQTIYPPIDGKATVYLCKCSHLNVKAPWARHTLSISLAKWKPARAQERLLLLISGKCTQRWTFVFVRPGLVRDCERLLNSFSFMVFCCCYCWFSWCVHGQSPYTLLTVLTCIPMHVTSMQIDHIFVVAVDGLIPSVITLWIHQFGVSINIIRW